MEEPRAGIPTIPGGVQTENDIAATFRELAIREREVIARERELAARETESKRSKWLNPVMVVLCAAVLGLFGNLWVAVINAGAARDLDRHRNRAAVIIETIKAPNPEAVLKALKFFSDRNLIDDPDDALRHAIYGITDVPPRPIGPTGLESIPVLPASGTSGQESVGPSGPTFAPRQR
jgi:hypothetical protein